MELSTDTIIGFVLLYIASCIACFSSGHYQGFLGGLRKGVAIGEERYKPTDKWSKYGKTD